MKTMHRRDFVRTLGLSAAALASPAILTRCGDSWKTPHPNVLFISLDDLNDWIEPLGGHPQARTPHLKRLAAEAVNFTHSYCSSPSCLPSRTALLTGIPSHRSGVYSNYQYWREALPEAETLPQRFMRHGYWTGGAGKIFHNDQPDPDSWNDYYPSKEKHMPDDVRPKRGATVNMPAFPNMYLDFDWAPLDVPMADMGDFKSVDWVIRQLGRRHEKPFFLACGIYRPHNPWYVPRKFYEMFPLESVKLPLVMDNDLADVGDRAREIAYRGGGYHRHVIEAGLWKNAVQGYLAAIAFADELLGRLLDALERSPYAANTIVAAWSDHGWQLGEKEHWRKFALWENVVRNVLMIKAPPGLPGLRGGAAAGRRTDRIVSLGDLHPTLLELAGIPPKTDMEYRSLVPLLKEPDRPWDHPALTTYDFSEFSVRVEGWRYTRYIDDSEELYDHRTDPEEWTNLAGDSRFQDVKKRLAGMIPDMQAPYPKTSYKIQPHHLPPFKSKEEYRAAKAAEARGEGRKPVPDADPWTIHVRDY